MYTLSDILAVINSNLELERKQRNIKASGHFSLSMHTKGEEENIALDTIIHFFNNVGQDCPVIRIHHAINKELPNKKEEFHKHDMVVLEALLKFLKFGKGELAYEKFVDGTFNHINIIE